MLGIEPSALTVTKAIRIARKAAAELMTPEEIADMISAGAVISIDPRGEGTAITFGGRILAWVPTRQLYDDEIDIDVGQFQVVDPTVPDDARELMDDDTDD